MALKEPESMGELVYMTNRLLDNNGSVMCWVYKQHCPKCGKGIMGKPKGDGGKVKIRAKAYTCPDCSYTVDMVEYEETLTACVKYTCPHCSNAADLETPFKRKKIEGVLTLRVKCSKCGGNIDITKKMKQPKKKGAKGPIDVDE